jgi:hypothetical protein
VGGEAVIVGLLTDLADRLDELIIGVVAASSGGFIGGWMALRAAKTSLDRAARASREERQAAAIAQRQSALTALVAELRLNAALLASEQTDHSPVAPAWRIPFRDAYVVALPYLASLPPEIQQKLQDAAIESSHYTAIAVQHNAQAASGPSAGRALETAQARSDQLRALAPSVSDRFLAAANQLSGYLERSSAADPPPAE